MGRSPCCDKVGLKKGPWTPEEDQKLLAFIEEHGHGSWRALPVKAGLQRCGKSCRLRWTNYLRPDIKRGKFSLQEEQTIIQLHALLGNRWSAIATHLPKRTDNEIKNYWNTHLKKRLAKMGIDPVTHKPKNDALLSAGDGHCNKSAANLSHMAQWESARLEAEARLVRQSKLRSASSIQAQTNQEFTSTSSPAQRQVVGPTRCLDVLKAWSNNGAAAAAWAANAGGMESPTSTLSSAANVGSSNFTTEHLVNNSGNSSDLTRDENNKSTIPLTITSSSSFLSSSSSLHDENASFMEKFTDLLLSVEQNHHGEDESDRAVVDGCFEDGKNYWDSILNLVNDSSPSDDHSPEF